MLQEDANFLKKSGADISLCASGNRDSKIPGDRLEWHCIDAIDR